MKVKLILTKGSASDGISSKISRSERCSCDKILGGARGPFFKKNRARIKILNKHIWLLAQRRRI